MYTTLQLLQLLQRALGKIEYEELVWKKGNNWFDPFRPSIQPSGYMNKNELINERRSHLKQVEYLFKNLDLFIFTLGLTETWLTSKNQFALPICPGGKFGEFSDEDYFFKNLNVNENINYLELFIDIIQSINPNAKILLSVSPVPIAATITNKHVIQASTYSKSNLRVVCEEICNNHKNVDYFASYEIITHTYNSHIYFLTDKRNVSIEGVEHVMQTFFCNFSEVKNDSVLKPRNAIVDQLDYSPQQCDEDELLKIINNDNSI